MVHGNGCGGGVGSACILGPLRWNCWPLRCGETGVINWLINLVKAMQTPDTARAVFGRIATLFECSPKIERGQRGNIPALEESLRGRQEGRPQAAARIGERERAGKKSPPWRARVLSGGAWRWMWWEVWGRPAPSVRSSGIVGRCVAVGVIAWRFSMLKAMHTPDTARAVFGRIATLCATSRRNRRC